MNTIEMTMSSSKTVGVSNRRDKWYARITVDGKNIHLGTFDTEDEAIQARKLAEKKYRFHENHGKELAF